MSVLEGKCLCGQLKYEVQGDIKKVVNCHCNLCRNMNGAAFSSYAVVLTGDFDITQGEVKRFAISQHSQKYFCEHCGTPIYNRNPKYAGLTMLYLGTLENPGLSKPDVNIYCDSELDWTSAVGDIPKFAQGI